MAKGAGRRIHVVKLPTAYAEGYEPFPIVCAKSSQTNYFLNDIVDSQIPNDPDIKGMQSLWRAVIVQMLMDAKTRKRNREFFYYKHQAIYWLFDNGPDFFTVCHLADLDPRYVRTKAIKAREMGYAWRAKIKKEGCTT